MSAVGGLSSGGSTNGEAGIKLAYQQAVANLIEGGSNRVILCTDGDFNVGVSGKDELVKLVQSHAKQSGVFLSIFGFGMGNLQDAKLEQLADRGNGHYGYIDSLNEAQKVFVEEMTGTLYTIAKDVKLQIEFNPAVVGSYRLVGYENRILAARDFNDDQKDAGDIGAGHTVTALYEIVPALPGDQGPDHNVDELKYQKQKDVPVDEKFAGEILTLKLRYKQPDEEQSSLLKFPLTDDRKDRKAMP